MQFLLGRSPEVGLIVANVSWIDFEDYQSSYALAESRHLLFVDGWFQAKANRSGFWIWTGRGKTLSSDLDFREKVDVDLSIFGKKQSDSSADKSGHSKQEGSSLSLSQARRNWKNSGYFLIN